MLEGKLMIIPAVGHQNKGNSSFTGSGLFVLMSQCGNIIELALQHGRFCTMWFLLQKPSCKQNSFWLAKNMFSKMLNEQPSVTMQNSFRSHIWRSHLNNAILRGSIALHSRDGIRNFVD